MLFGREVLVPQPGEYVADGAARQAAWALLGGDTPPQWNLGDVSSTHSPATPGVIDAYRTLRDRTSNW
jgi:xylulokinase